MCPKTIQIPLSLYIHFPWCVQKCPYCDFNSHTLRHSLDAPAYVDRLLIDLTDQVQQFAITRPIRSIFMGGGTPSLFPTAELERLLRGVDKICQLSPDCEITIEANPGTDCSAATLRAFSSAGINRISIGVQSFQMQHLQALGRIHSTDDTYQAIENAKQSGLKRINVDIMFGLPNQTLDEAISDLQEGIDSNVDHISWYQLTLEPNTEFHHKPPQLPEDDLIADMQDQGQALLGRSGLIQYEISAYSKQSPCIHNLNYWQFGDYLAIGAGAHAKVTDTEQRQITRFANQRQPKRYMDPTVPIRQQMHLIDKQAQPFEFFMNALRLTDGIPMTLLRQRTFCEMTTMQKAIERAITEGYLQVSNDTIQPTPFGHRFLNDCLAIFLSSA